MNNTQNKHRTLFAPDLAVTTAVSRTEADPVKDLIRSDSWLSRRASQESSALPSHKHVRVHSQVKIFDSSPFHQHERSYQTELAGSVQICVNIRTKKELSVKEIPNCTKLMIQQLKPAIHESIVQFSAAYYFKDSIYLVYERMLVSLEEIYATPKGHIPDTGIASVSLSILKGLAYIHENLKMSHGAINGENVLLNSLGQVKIANLGDVMLQEQPVSKQQRDIQDFGIILRNMLEPGSSLIDPDSSRLQRPSQCNYRAVNLLHLTQTSTASELCKHDFLQTESDTLSLQIRVLSTAASRKCQVVVFGST